MKFVCDVNASSTPRYAVMPFLFSILMAQPPIENKPILALHVSLQGSVLEGMGVSVQWNVSETRCERSAKVDA